MQILKGPQLAPYHLGKVRHSLSNGAMEKGASAGALSSTSGDEIVGKGGSRDPINSPKWTTFRVTCIRDLATRCYMLPTAIQSSSTIFMGQSQAASRASSLMPGK